MNSQMFPLGIKFEGIVKLRLPLVNQVRYRRVDIRRPLTHLDRELTKTVTAPKYPPKLVYCSKIKQDSLNKEHHPLHIILGNELRQQLFNAPLVAVFHAFSKKADQLYAMRIQLNKINMVYIPHTQESINIALKGTSYEPLLKLYEDNFITFISEEAQFAKLLKIEKKIPIAKLIGGVYDGRLISISDFNKLAQIPSIEGLHGQLSGILASPARKVSSNLTSHQAELSNLLHRYIADQSDRKQEPDN